MCVHQAVHPKKNPASLSGQAGRSAGGFTSPHQNGGRHYLGSDSRLPDRHAHLLFSTTGTGQWGEREKKKKQVGHILSVFSCLNACRLQTDGCRVASASKKKRGRGCRSQRVLSEMCQQTLAWPGLHSDSPLTVSSTTISPWRRQSQVTVYNIWKKTEDVHSGSNYWIKTSTKLILCKLVKYVSPSNVLFPVCHRISRWRWELHDQWCCVWEYSIQWNIDWGVTHVTFLPVDVPIVTGVQYLPRWPISVQKSIVPLSRFSICST